MLPVVHPVVARDSPCASHFLLPYRVCNFGAKQKTLLMPSPLHPTPASCILLPPTDSSCILPLPPPTADRQQQRLKGSSKDSPGRSCSLPIAWPQSRKLNLNPFPFPNPNRSYQSQLPPAPFPFPAVHLCDILYPLYPTVPYSPLLLLIIS